MRPGEEADRQDASPLGLSMGLRWVLSLLSFPLLLLGFLRFCPITPPSSTPVRRLLLIVYFEASVLWAAKTKLRLARVVRKRKRVPELGPLMCPDPLPEKPGDTSCPASAASRCRPAMAAWTAATSSRPASRVGEQTASPRHFLKTPLAGSHLSKDQEPSKKMRCR